MNIDRRAYRISRLRSWQAMLNGDESIYIPADHFATQLGAFAESYAQTLSELEEERAGINLSAPVSDLSGDGQAYWDNVRTVRRHFPKERTRRRTNVQLSRNVPGISREARAEAVLERLLEQYGLLEVSERAKFWVSTEFNQSFADIFVGGSELPSPYTELDNRPYLKNIRREAQLRTVSEILEHLDSDPQSPSLVQNSAGNDNARLRLIRSEG